MLNFHLFLIFIIISILAYCVEFYRKNRKFYELAAKLPGNNGLSIIESILMAIKMTSKNRLQILLSFFKEELPITKNWIMGQLVIVTKDADFVNKVFNSPETYNKPGIIYNGFIMTNGIVVLGGNEHKRHRKIFNKAFSPNMLKIVPEIFDEKSKKILKMMADKEECGEFDLIEYTGAYALESFSKTNLNFEMEYFKSYVYEAFEGSSHIMESIMPFSVIGLTKLILNGVNFGGKVSKLFQKFNKFTNEVIESNRTTNNARKNTIIDLILDPNNGFSERDVRDELILFVVGAIETSMKTIATAIMMLGIHKDVQQKLNQEIDEIYSSEDNHEFTAEFLQKFSYLDMVVKETLRLFNVAPVVGRKSSADVDINGYLIPKDTSILISIYSMHRDEKYWGKDAHLFRPERFEVGPTNPHAFIPFAAGSRICIGNRYGMMVVKIFLINLLRTYRIDCLTKFDEIELEVPIVLNFVDGYKASIYKK